MLRPRYVPAIARLAAATPKTDPSVSRSDRTRSSRASSPTPSSSRSISSRCRGSTRTIPATRSAGASPDSGSWSALSPRTRRTSRVRRRRTWGTGRPGADPPARARTASA
eukprot:31387-Pelagococcus_subviridis.AAC.10